MTSQNKLHKLVLKKKKWRRNSRSCTPPGPSQHLLSRFRTKICHYTETHVRVLLCLHTNTLSQHNKSFWGLSSRWNLLISFSFLFVPHRGGTNTKFPHLVWAFLFFPEFSRALPQLTQNNNRNTWHLSKVLTLAWLCLSLTLSALFLYSVPTIPPSPTIPCWRGLLADTVDIPQKFLTPPFLCTVACIFCLFLSVLL